MAFLTLNMEKGGWMVIVNPKAGSGRGLKDWPVISNLMNRSGLDFTCVFTEHKYHAVEMTVKAVNDGYRKIVAIGGDGTVHEIVNGLFIQKVVPTTEISLAVIPTGTGNDWIRMFGISKTYTEAVQSLVDHRTVIQDVAKVEFYETKVKQHRYMANVAGMGFDAAVNIKYNRLKDEGKVGKWLYITSSIKVFLRYISKRFKIKIDDQLYYDGYLFSSTVGIGRYNGGGMDQMPAAKIDDGLMDITMIKRMQKLMIMKNFRYLYSGRIYDNPKVMHEQAKKIEIETWPPSRIEIDGEAMGYSPFTFELIPGSIKVVVGPKFVI